MIERIDALPGKMLAALEADTSWCDDFGEATIRETARRTAAICAEVIWNASASEREHTAALAGALRELADAVDGHPAPFMDSGEILDACESARALLAIHETRTP